MLECGIVHARQRSPWTFPGQASRSSRRRRRRRSSSGISVALVAAAVVVAVGVVVVAVVVLVVVVVIVINSTWKLVCSICSRLYRTCQGNHGQPRCFIGFASLSAASPRQAALTVQPQACSSQSYPGLLSAVRTWHNLESKLHLKLKA